MRYLRQQNINRRAPYDQRLYVDMTDSIVMTTTNNMLMPKGTTTERPASPVTGMMRYNTTTNQVEIYQGSSATWRAIRYKESTQINKQSYLGDGVTADYGPLNPQPPTIIDSDSTWSGDNLIIIVGGVFQIYNTNYLIVDGSEVSGGTTGLKYVRFTSASPGLNTPITFLHGFDK